MIATAPAIDYHSHPAVSKTGLKCFRESRRLFHGRHILRLPEAQLKLTPAMNLGTLTHAELLEPGSLANQYAVLTDWPDFRTHAAQRWRNEQEAAGKMVVKESDIAAMAAMVEAVTNEVADWFTPDAKIEQPLFWKDRETEMECRCKPDWLIPRRDFVVAFDFKTTADASPSAFERQANTLELFLQDQHYRAGIEETYGVRCEFYFVVAETSYPFRVSIETIEHDEAVHAEYHDTMSALALCQVSDDWREPWEGKINRVNIWERSLRSDAMAVTQ